MKPSRAMASSASRTASSAKPLHPDFGTVYAGAPNGIPYIVVPSGTPGIAVSFAYSLLALVSAVLFKRGRWKLKHV